jgi:hypothetical protein
MMMKDILTIMDALDPVYKEIEKANRRPMPRYHLKDGDEPTLVDVYEEYPNEKLKFIYVNGYVYVGNEFGDRYFMSMHCCSNRKEDVLYSIEHLKEIRSNKKVTLKEVLE